MTEVVTSLPIKRPPHEVRIDVTPHGSVVAASTAYGTYTWDEVEVDGVPGRTAIPAMYYHSAGQELTFTAEIIRGVDPPNIVEIFWDFGDGTEAVGNPVTHTYRTVGNGVIAHCRARDVNGDEAWASINLMLQPVAPPPAEYFYYTHFNEVSVNDTVPLTNDGTGKYWLRDEFGAHTNDYVDGALTSDSTLYGDVEVTLKFRNNSDYNNSNPEFGLFVKGFNVTGTAPNEVPGNYLHCYGDADYLEIMRDYAWTNVGNSGGYFPDPLYENGRVVSAGDNWWRMRIIGNTVTVEAFDTDPALPSTNPRAATRAVLTGQNATAFGAGVTGRVGLGFFSNDSTGQIYIDGPLVIDTTPTEPVYDPPVADFTIVNNSFDLIPVTTFVTGTSYTLDATASVSSARDQNYIWDYGDGSPAQDGQMVSHTWTQGTYDVSLTITDCYGLSDTYTRQIVVGDGTILPGQLYGVKLNDATSRRDVLRISPIKIAPYSTYETAIAAGVGGVSMDYPVGSPNGRKIAAVRGKDLYIWSAEGTDMTLAVSAPPGTNSTILCPSWSPDSNKVAFTSFEFSGGGPTLCTTRLGYYKLSDQTTTILKSEGPQSLSLGFTNSPQCWNSDGTKLCFFHLAPANVRTIKTINVDGSGETVFATISSNTNQNNAIWSPDGTKIAWVEGDVDWNDLIRYAPASGGAATTVLDVIPGYNFGHRLYSWTGDSNGLIFEEFRGTYVLSPQRYQVEKINLNGTGRIGIYGKGDINKMSLPVWAPATVPASGRLDKTTYSLPPVYSSQTIVSGQTYSGSITADTPVHPADSPYKCVVYDYTPSVAGKLNATFTANGANFMFDVWRDDSATDDTGIASRFTSLANVGNGGPGSGSLTAGQRYLLLVRGSVFVSSSYTGSYSFSFSFVPN